MPASGRSGRDEYLAAHIPGARFLDIDEVSDRSNPAPHMLPSAADFGAAMERARHRPRRPHRRLRQFADPDRRARLVHAPPLRRRARSRSSTAASRNGSPKAARPKRGEPACRGGPLRRRRARRSRHQGSSCSPGPACRWLDARGKPRFEGSEADPRPGVAAGPCSRAPATCRSPRSTARTARSSRVDEIRRLFAEAGVDPTRPFVASCGSGVTANSLIFAAHLLGNDEAGFTTAAGASGAPTRRRRRRWVPPRRGRCRRPRAARGGSGRPASCSPARCGSRPAALAEQRLDPGRGRCRPAAPSGGRTSGCFASPASSQRRRDRFVADRASGPAPKPPSTSRSAWRTLASRDTASA